MLTQSAHIHSAISCSLTSLLLLLVVVLQAKLRVVPWDGYLKYYNLGEKHPQLIEKRRKVRAGGGTGGKLWTAWAGRREVEREGGR